MSTDATGTLLAEIKARGYWQITISPVTYDETLLPYEQLAESVDRSRVSVRGWSFPPRRSDVRHLNKYVEGVTDTDMYREVWRYYQSGQFAYIGGYREDWRDRSNFHPADAGWRPCKTLGVLEVVFRYVEVFEFAKRLLANGLSVDALRIRARMHNLAGRELQLRVYNRVPLDPRTIDMPAWDDQRDVTKAELVADPRRLARLGPIEFLKRCDWMVTDDLVRGLQDELNR